MLALDSNVLSCLDHDNPKVTAEALNYVFELTAIDEGLQIIFDDQTNVCVSLTKLLLSDDKNVARTSYSTLINLAADLRGATMIMTTSVDLNVSSNQNIIEPFRKKSVSWLLTFALDPNCEHRALAAQVLSNLTRFPEVSAKLINYVENLINFVKEMVEILCDDQESGACTTLLHAPFDLASVLSNITQVEAVRCCILSTDSATGLYVLEKIFQLFSSPNLVVRNGVYGAVRNLCFENGYHYWLLITVDVLSAVVLPLAGPESFSNEDTKKLPVDLQYLAADKTREPEHKLRKMLLEILLQLCSERLCREFIRNSNIYVILREYHKWENNDDCRDICEDVVNIIIQTEDEIGADSLKNLLVPEDLAEKFKKEPSK